MRDGVGGKLRDDQTHPVGGVPTVTSDTPLFELPEGEMAGEASTMGRGAEPDDEMTYTSVELGSGFCVGNLRLHVTQRGPTALP